MTRRTLTVEVDGFHRRSEAIVIAHGRVDGRLVHAACDARIVAPAVEALAAGADVSLQVEPWQVRDVLADHEPDDPRVVRVT